MTPYNLSANKIIILIVDMQNDFVAEGFFLDKIRPDFLDKKHPNITSKRDLVKKLKDFLKIIRKHDIPIIYIKSFYNYLKGPLKEKFIEAEVFGNLCVEGSAGARIVEDLKPEVNDRVIIKGTHSAFINTKLKMVLDNDFKTRKCILLTGVESNTCIESTMRDASALGFYAYLIEDLVSSSHPHLHFSMLENCRKYFGWVMSSSEVINLIEEMSYI